MDRSDIAKKVIVGILIVGIILSLAFIVTINRRQFIEKQAIDNFAESEIVEIYATTNSVASGEVLTEDNVAKVKWLDSLLPEGALHAGDQVRGKIALVPLPKNAVVVESMLDGATEPLEVPKNKSAISIPTSAIRAVGAEIRPKDTIDIYVVENGSATLASVGVEVLKTSQNKKIIGEQSAPLSAGSKDLSWLVLAVEPSQVEYLLSCASKDSLYIALPGQMEDTKSE